MYSLFPTLAAWTGACEVNLQASKSHPYTSIHKCRIKRGKKIYNIVRRAIFSLGFGSYHNSSKVDNRL
jgi:hypothetical protein